MRIDMKQFFQSFCLGKLKNNEQSYIMLTGWITKLNETRGKAKNTPSGKVHDSVSFTRCEFTW